MELLKKISAEISRRLKPQGQLPKIPLLILIPFSLILADQIIKNLLLQMMLEDPGAGADSSFLGFSFGVFENRSWLFGLGKTLAPPFSMSFASGLMANLIFIYIILIYYLPASFQAALWPLSLVFAGSLSNLFDKALSGYVVDTIAWRTDFAGAYINLADIFQTAGWILLAIALFRIRKKIWRKSEQRKRFLVKKKYQIELIAYVTLILFIVSLFFVVLNHQFMEYFQELGFEEQEEAAGSFFLYSVAMLLLFLFPLLAASLYISNKIYGPVYAFERHIKSLLDDKNPSNLQLRKNDHLKELEALSLSIKTKISQLKSSGKK